MTASIVQSYINASNDGSKRKLLVCGPTNKSVVVLATRVIEQMSGTNLANFALIGDKHELLVDNEQVLEPWFVYTVTKHWRKRWKRLQRHLLRHLDFDYFDDMSNALLLEMRRRLSSVRRLEEPVKNLTALRLALPDLQEHEELSDSFDEARKDREQLINDLFEDIDTQLKEMDEQELVKDLLDSADVVFCTLSSAGSMPVQRMHPADDLIVDEASAATVPEVFIPLHCQPKRLLLVGDPQQLPPTVQSPLALKYGLDESLQERLMKDNLKENTQDFVLLDVQYRMNPAISLWPMTKFYSGRVTDGDNVVSDRYKSQLAFFTSGDPYTWVAVTGKEEKDDNLSTFNESEASAVVSILLDLKAASKGSKSLWCSPDALRVITFYKAQVDRLRFLLMLYNLGYVVVSTVDSSQGCEADVVVLSFVRGTSGHVGFLKDDRRLNVALTRARRQLICVGDLHALAGLEEVGGNLQVRELASDALSRAVIKQPGHLPPPPKKKTSQAPNSKNAKAPKKNKRSKKKKGGKK